MVCGLYFNKDVTKFFFLKPLGFFSVEKGVLCGRKTEPLDIPLLSAVEHAASCFHYDKLPQNVNSLLGPTRTVTDPCL